MSSALLPSAETQNCGRDRLREILFSGILYEFVRGEFEPVVIDGVATYRMEITVERFSEFQEEASDRADYDLNRELKSITPTTACCKTCTTPCWSPETGVIIRLVA